jgi:hypothetical protein
MTGLTAKSWVVLVVYAVVSASLPFLLVETG